MPRIDPQQLLKTLGVLLSPTGGIKSNDEVVRISTLMHKFSKKLVSKCIYVQILLATSEELLDRFLDENGWSLLNTWFSDAIKNQNWPFTKEMICLFAHCPISARRLKDNVELNPAPKLINQLRSDPNVDDIIRKAATAVYDKWLLVVSPDKRSATSESSSIVDSIMDETTSEDTTSSSSLDKVSVERKQKPENGSISLLQSLAEEVAEKIKQEEGSREDDKVKPNSGSAKSKDLDKNHDKSRGKERRSSSSSKDKSRKDKESQRDDRKKRREDRMSEKERKRFRPDRRDEVDDVEKQRIKEVARRMREQEQQKKEQEQQKKDKDTLSKLGGGTGSPMSSLSKIPKIPKKQQEKGPSFEDMLGGLDVKPKTVKTPMNKNKTASLLEGLSKSSSVSKGRDSSSKQTGGSATSSGSSRRDSDKHKSSSSVRKESSSSHSHSSRSHHSRSHSHHSHSHHHSSSSKKDGALPKDHERDRRPSKLSMPEKRHSTDSNNESPKSAKSPHNFSESTGFMDAIFHSMNRDAPRRKKRRLSESENSKNEKEPATISSKKDSEENQTNKTADVPAFSFYKDTLEDNAATEEEEKTKTGENEDREKSEKDDDASSVSSSADDTKNDAQSPKDNDDDMPFEEPESMPREVKGILVYHRGRDYQKKSITWKPETTLVAVKYFELDEDERVNVNKIKFENMREIELKMEKAAMKSKASVDADEKIMQWYRPLPIDLEKREEPFEFGSKSVEKGVQQMREKNILQALYFNKAMTPPSPAEPDPEIEPKKDALPTIIPLDDVENGDESVEDYSSKDWLDPKVNAVDRQANIESSFSLPPSLQNLLNTVNLTNILPAQQPAEMSQEERDVLTAQTEAMRAMGMLPGVDMPPPFPPPVTNNPPPNVPPPNVPPMGLPPILPPPGHPPNGGPSDSFPPPHFPPSNFGPGGAPVPPPGFSGPPPMPPGGNYGPPGGPPPDYPPPGPPPFRGGFNGRNFHGGPPPNRGFRGNFPRDRGGRGGRFQPQDSYRIKTKPCNFFAQGYCRDGDECRFIHDMPGPQRN